MDRMITFQDVQRLLPFNRVATNITETSFDVQEGRSSLAYTEYLDENLTNMLQERFRFPFIITTYQNEQEETWHRFTYRHKNRPNMYFSICFIWKEKNTFFQTTSWFFDCAYDKVVPLSYLDLSEPDRIEMNVVTRLAENCLMEDPRYRLRFITGEMHSFHTNQKGVISYDSL